MLDPKVELERIKRVMDEDEQKMREYEKMTSGKKPDLSKAEAAVRTAETNLKKAQIELDKAKTELEETHTQLKELSDVSRKRSELETKMRQDKATLDKVSQLIK